MTTDSDEFIMLVPSAADKRNLYQDVFSALSLSFTHMME